MRSGVLEAQMPWFCPQLWEWDWWFRAEEGGSRDTQVLSSSRKGLGVRAGVWDAWILSAVGIWAPGVPVPALPKAVTAWLRGGEGEAVFCLWAWPTGGPSGSSSLVWGQHSQVGLVPGGLWAPAKLKGTVPMHTPAGLSQERRGGLMGAGERVPGFSLALGGESGLGG